MSGGKLDQSLDQIMTDTKPAGGRRGRGRAPRRAKVQAKAAIAAPTGGVQKSKAATKAAPSAAAALVKPSTSGESKIIVSNLPDDVTETQIKDYFSQTIGNVKKVLLTYGPNGRSRGVATIFFRSGDAGAKAVKQLDGVKVDNRPMKVELIMGSNEITLGPGPKGLAERMAKPKSAAKEKTKEKSKTNGAATTNGSATKKTNNARKAGRAGRPKKKTAEELDAEMADYFNPGDAAPANGTTQPAAAAVGGGDAMVDEVL